MPLKLIAKMFFIVRVSYYSLDYSIVFGQALSRILWLDPLSKLMFCPGLGVQSSGDFNG